MFSKNKHSSLFVLSISDEEKGFETSAPACGPLEGLALMYILREQGALVTSNSTVSNRYLVQLFKEYYLRNS